MDDIQFVSSNTEDLVIFNKVFSQFEAQSGAMLSRDRKSKVMGLGQWQGRQDWPLEWIQSSDELKVLGFTVCPQFSDTASRIWETVFRGFQCTLFAWEGRALCTLQQRVTLTNTFALSKLWYVAQVLPLPPAMTKKVESAISNFVFRGRHERLKLAELENPVKRGGLGLTCVATKAECLLLRQSLRILTKPEEKSSRHIGHWLGRFLQDSFPQLELLGPVCQTLVPRFPLHPAMLVALEEGLARQEFDPKELESTSTKSIYKGRVADVVPPPKVEEKNPRIDFVDLVYPRLAYRILESGPKDILFTLVHDFYHTKERLFCQGRAQDSSCPIPECQGRVQDREHIFCSCTLVAGAWTWLRTRLLKLLPTTVGAVGITSEDFLLLQFPRDTMDKEVVWLMGNYCEIVTNISKGRRLSADQVAGRLRTRLSTLRGRAVVQPELYVI